MRTIIKISILNCCGCANALHQSLSEVRGVFGVKANMLTGEVTIEHTEEVSPEELAAKLTSLGYSDVSIL